MRIAIVNDTIHPYFKGGAQKRVYEISRRLVQRGHQVHWYGMDYGHRELEGIQLHAVCPNYKMYTREGRRIMAQAIKFGIRLNIREKVDIIDCMNFPYLHCFRAKEAAIRQRIPLIITWFEFWGDYWYKYMNSQKVLGWIGKTLEKSITHLPDRIIADSLKVKSQLVEAGYKQPRIKVIPDGVDLALINSTRPSREKFDVVYVGRLLAHKNVNLIIEAVAELPAVRLAIIGEGNSRAMCETLVTDLKLTGRVKFFGRLPEDRDVYAIMKSSRVLVIPSIQEGHPLVIPEANACGIPAIGIQGVCDEFISMGDNGYLVNAHKLPLQRTIARALELYPELAQTCRDMATRYDWELITDQVELTYKELL